MQFINERLPQEVEVNAIRREREDIAVVRTDGGFEVRNARHSESRFEYDISFPAGGFEDSVIEAVYDLFRASRGGLHVFRFRDWDPKNNSLTDEAIGVGDGATTIFQITQSHVVGGVTASRTIRLPCEPVTVKVDGVEQASGVSVDTTTGEVIFDSAPANESEVCVSCAYDIPVRFDLSYQATALASFLEHIDSLALVEVKGPVPVEYVPPPPPPPPANLEFIGEAAASSNSSPATLVVDISHIDLQEGDCIIVASGWGGNADGNPGVPGYTEIVDLYSDDNADANLSVAYKFADGTETSVTVTGYGAGGSTGMAAAVLVWRGIHEALTVHDFATAVGTNSQRPVPPAITPFIEDNVIIVAGLGARFGSVDAFTSDTAINQAGGGSTPGCRVGMFSDYGSLAPYSPSAWGGGGGFADPGGSWCAATIVLRKDI